MSHSDRSYTRGRTGIDYAMCVFLVALAALDVSLALINLPGVERRNVASVVAFVFCSMIAGGLVTAAFGQWWGWWR